MSVGSYSLNLRLTQYTNNENFVTGPLLRACHIRMRIGFSLKWK